MKPIKLPPFFSGKPLPALTDILSQAHLVSLPMVTTFRAVSLRESLLIRGPAGWGEFSPFLEYGPRESAAWLAAALEAAWLGFPKSKRNSLAVNASLPAVKAEEVKTILARFDGDLAEIKVKVAQVGQTLADDIARLREVRRLFPRARLKVDANAGWNYQQALLALRELEEFNLLYIEQPVASLSDMVALRQAIRQEGLRTLVAADELVRKAEDPLEVARRGAADVIVVKVAPLGGVRRASQIVQQAGLPAVVSSALETSVGIRAGLALASSLDSLPYGCGLDTVSLLEKDVCLPSLRAEQGWLRLGQEPQPQPQLLRAYRPDRERCAWWQQRLKLTYTALEQMIGQDGDG